jgi:hypothetical protein
VNHARRGLTSGSIDLVVETEVTVHPWYRQFYLRRGDAAWRSDEISDDGYARGAESVGGFVFVGTTMYGSPTQVRVRVHPSDPGPSEASDRAVEVLIEGEGDLAVLHWEPGEPPAAEVALPSGTVRARVSWHGTAEAQEHPNWDLGGDELSPEHIVLDIWPH